MTTSVSRPNAALLANAAPMKPSAPRPITIMLRM